MKNILYLGTDPSHFAHVDLKPFEYRLIHCPVIKVVPRSIELPEIRFFYNDLKEYTHFIFTSKNAVKVFMDHIESLRSSLSYMCIEKDQIVIAIGGVTAAALHSYGVIPNHVAEVETQEGMVALMHRLNFINSYLFLPRSSLSRSVIFNFLKERQIRFQACDLYDIVTDHNQSLSDLEGVDEIIFTSPSTVHAFLEVYGRLPCNKTLRAIGPVTEKFLRGVVNYE